MVCRGVRWSSLYHEKQASARRRSEAAPLLQSVGVAVRSVVGGFWGRARGKARRKGGVCVFNVESDSLIERKSTGHAVTRSGNVLAWWLPFVCVSVG